MVHAFPPRDTLAPGTIIAGRFTLQRLAGQGGAGLVYQARDSVSGHLVALKLLHTIAESESARRFAREAELLAQLHHPGIVSYVAHGLTDERQPFLAMEWLEGEDLSRRLARQPLGLSDTLLLLRRVSEVLAVTHARGIVHRDIKPSNLFLRRGRAVDVVLVDFGLARISEASSAFTGSAMVLGTPGYMAPEQASSKQDISPSADIFSLGCVLYECLSGQAPFRAAHIAAVLAKILFTDPPPLRTLRAELPASLQALVDRMLAKDPEQRLADGQQLQRMLAELDVLPELPAPEGRGTAAVPPRLPSTEQHLVSVVLATPTVYSGEARTLNPDEAVRLHDLLSSLKKELRAHRARATLLVDGSLLATFLLEHGTATDQAALAAHCALSVKERWPESLVALTTGLSLRSAPMPVGEVVDRAGELLRHLEGGAELADAPVILDETTAGLLGPRFQLDKTDSGKFVLRGEHLSVDESRPLLGRPTRCVGREQELSLLELAFATCMEDSTARALLVTAPAGTGKSRLRSEFLRRLEHRGQKTLTLFGRGDPMNAGSAYGLLGQAVRQLCGVVDREPLEVRREKLSQRLSRYLLPEQMKDTVEFLGELCGVPFPSEDSPKLHAAREDPRLMSLQVARAMVAFLRAESSQGPMLLVLEDLHWSDAPTVRLVDEVLHELSDTPLLVLALARPEVKELFPGLWAQSLQEVPLRGLSQRASTQLAHEVLGRQVPEALVSRLVEQAAGNALFLEELIRGVAEGRGEETPGTVLAILQSRLQRLEPELRRVLRAASIFGRTFWLGGVKALLEGELSAE
ncbi:serine/threonine-protein kinase, partial [Hyalangium sp.]|uniref:serine/threonine-protein kinase n=1 Tax=Hyalangium sp. TaxID=2028555 RepID=UPI002D745D0B